MLQCLIGNKYGPDIVPLSFQSDIFDEIIKTAETLNENVDLIRSWYEKNDTEYRLKEYR